MRTGNPVRGHRRGSEWRRLTYGLYRSSLPARSLAHDLDAWRLLLPEGAAFTHLTAAELCGWWMPGQIRCPVFVALPERGRYPRRPGLVVSRHREGLPTTEFDGLPVTTAAETLLAACRDLGLLDLAVLGDSALRLKQLTLTELEETARWRRRGVRRLRQLVPLLDKRSQSPWESIMRLLHRAADIPVEPQMEVIDAFGRVIAHADLGILGTNRIHEYDGDVHRERGVHRKDLARERGIAEQGTIRFGYTSVELRNDGASIIAAADRALGRSWDPRRIQRWNALLDDSLLGMSGRRRVHQRWSGG